MLSIILTFLTVKKNQKSSVTENMTGLLLMSWNKRKKICDKITFALKHGFVENFRWVPDLDFKINSRSLEQIENYRTVAVIYTSITHVSFVFLSPVEENCRRYHS